MRVEHLAFHRPGAPRYQQADLTDAGPPKRSWRDYLDTDGRTLPARSASCSPHQVTGSSSAP
ncbi:hypothetical protein ABZ297_29355 [Nonomuraea sp. NPDC005983]|uniref:hypothetical protein n=1 Tax=Nonomuraea sp. NPDC005983 TaxID=3155595 RepID=UPI0033A1BBF8